MYRLRMLGFCLKTVCVQTMNSKGTDMPENGSSVLLLILLSKNGISYMFNV